jgi:glycosyltransferase involved in cell wall biosynthesis
MGGTSAPLISVIVPSYNYAHFMAACVGSVVEQDYPNMELVVVDDRSKDDSVNVTKRLSTQDDVERAFRGRVRVELNPKNLGAHETINRGIRLSTGEYIAILNADDTYGPERLNRMIQAMKSAGSRFAFSKVEFIDEDGQHISRPSPLAHRLRHRQSAIERFPTVGFACLASNVAISTGNFLFERRLFDEVGPFRNLRYCHDWDFLLQCLLVTEPLYVPESVYNYRIHGSNSFRSLENVAASESAAVYRNYFDRATMNRHANRKAPGLQAWPGVLESFMDAYGLWPHWSGTKPDRA